MSFEPGNSSGIRRELEQANISLNYHLAERKKHDEEVDRWTQIVGQLEQTIQLLESPATAIRRKPKTEEALSTVNVTVGTRRPMIRWKVQLPIVLCDLALRNVRPTKRELISEIRARYGVNEATGNQAVNSAIRTGDLKLVLDRCYIPGTEPGKAQGAS